MMKFFITLLCVGLALPGFAEVARLSRSGLKDATIVREHVSNVSSVSSAESVQTLQQFLRERNLAINGSYSPQYRSIEELTGAKIASVDAYNFDWDNETGTAEINVSACAMMGKYCKLTTSPSGNAYLSYFYGDFKLPLIINATTGVVAIRTCEPLHTMDNSIFDPTSDVRLPHFSSSTVRGDTLWTLYAVPLSWLMGDNDCDEYIYGQVNVDGTIMINDDFAFLVKTVSGDEVSWGLSPIFKNLTLLTPNGTHEFDYTRLSIHDVLYQDGLGCGGLVPRPHKPGSSKPVSPRPFSPFIGVTPPKRDGNQPMYNDFDNGGGARIDFKPRFKTYGGNNDHYTPTTTRELEPVYMFWTDASTLMVYNLFGMGMCCYLTIDKENGTMQLPAQQIYNNGVGTVLSNLSCDGMWSQDCSTWTLTETKTPGTPINFSPKFGNNVLQFSGDSSPFVEPPLPVFSEPIVSDTTVTFHATTPGGDGMAVVLYKIDEEDEPCVEVENPLTVPRLAQSYWVNLAAIAYNPVTGVKSEEEWFFYEVPALEPGVVDGDVNGDGTVTAADVSVLYNFMLNNDESNMVNGDQNGDGTISSSDITIVYNILLHSE